jgi:glycosyltransferase involved in cell wall biosynthesis
MHISLVTRIFTPEPAAASFRLDALVRALADLGDEVVVITTTPPASLRGAELPARRGIRVRRAKVLRDRAGHVRGYFQYLSFDVPVFFRVLLSRRVDVVVVEPPPTTGVFVRLACAIRRTPYVYYAADVWSDGAVSTGAPGFVVTAVRWLERTALSGAAAVIAVTDGVADKVRALAPSARVGVVPNGIDTEIFTLDGERRADSAWGVYAGTTSEWQGADIFIRAMPRVLRTMPDATIAFLGQGSAWTELRTLAAEVAPDAISFIDSVPPSDAAVWLRSARAGLVSLRPEQGYDFAMPTKVFASTACGTPVVFAGTGAGADLVAEARLGWSVRYDVEAVADAMLHAFATSDDIVRTAVGAWTRSNASQSARAREAASVVRSVARQVPQ